MKATACAWHKACRYQQAITKVELETSGNGESCWADGVRCNDLVVDMEKRCKLFLIAKSHEIVQEPVS